MKIIKPLRMSLLQRTFEIGGAYHFVATPMVFVPIGERRALLSEIELWKSITPELGPTAAIDAGMPKTDGEWLVSGRAYAPGGIARPVVQVTADVAGSVKKLAVFGHRHWGTKVLRASDPVPFVEMPVDWTHAFGGSGFVPNPVGKRGGSNRNRDAGPLHVLPNVEDPRNLVVSPGDRPTPAGFGALDSSWPQRAKNLGSYDKKWLETDYPGFPADLHWSFFNTAPEDQRRPEFFSGDETYAFENMHPTLPRVAGKLPGITTRCFITQRTSEGNVFRELVPRLETVHFFPHLERALLLFRATTIVREDDAADIANILVACEDIGDRRPVAHYEAVVAERLDKSKAGVAHLRERDLVPEWAAGSFRDIGGKELEARTSGQLLRKNLRGKLEREVAASRNYVTTLGLDPDVHGPTLDAEPPDPSLDEIPELAEKLRVDIERRKQEEQARLAEEDRVLKKLFEDNGLDFSLIEKERTTVVGGPPKNSAEIDRVALEKICADCRAAGYVNDEIESMLADPAIWKEKAKLDQMARSTYRLTAHIVPGAPPPISAEAKRALRASVETAYANGESFEAWDLTNADLSGLNLADANFRDAFLEGADLGGADLRGADLTGAVLARADLSTANLENATLVEANLGAANLRGIRAKGANLTSAILAKSTLDGASLMETKLDRADLSGAFLGSADFTGATASNLLFMKTDLAGAKFARTTLERAIFMEVSVEGVDFSEASLKKSVFLRARGRGASFRDAEMANLRLVEGCDFTGASFVRAKMQMANLRGSLLRDADFSFANLEGADLSEAELQGAKLVRANLRRSMLVRAKLEGAVLTGANLMNAILQKAELGGADLRGANLHEADMARVRLSDTTRVEDANLKRTRVQPLHRP